MNPLPRLVELDRAARVRDLEAREEELREMLRRPGVPESRRELWVAELAGIWPTLGRLRKGVRR